MQGEFGWAGSVFSCRPSKKWCGLFAPEHRQLAKEVEDALTKAVVR